MTNSEIFLDFYNKIDEYLKNSTNDDSYMTFAQKVRNTKNKAVPTFKDQLLKYGELRNAIVHNTKIGTETIAEPHDNTVTRIAAMYEKIINPKKVIPEFQFDVLGAKEDDYINEILVEMERHSFSQFPIFDINNEIIELINTNTISRWLSSQLDESGTILMENVKVKDLVSNIEFEKNYKFISRKTSIYEAYELFINQINNKRRNLDVLFITDSGKPTEKLLGLLTIEDIANIVFKELLKRNKS